MVSINVGCPYIHIPLVIRRRFIWLVYCAVYACRFRVDLFEETWQGDTSSSFCLPPESQVLRPPATIVHGDHDQDCLVQIKVRLPPGTAAGCFVLHSTNYPCVALGSLDHACQLAVSVTVASQTGVPRVQASCFIRSLRALLAPRQLALLSQLLHAMGTSSTRAAAGAAGHGRRDHDGQRARPVSAASPGSVGTDHGATGPTAPRLDRQPPGGRPLTAKDYNIIEDLLANMGQAGHSRQRGRGASAGSLCLPTHLVTPFVCSAAAGDPSEGFATCHASDPLRDLQCKWNGLDFAWTGSLFCRTRTCSFDVLRTVSLTRIRSRSLYIPRSRADAGGSGAVDVRLWGVDVQVLDCSLVLIEKDTAIYPDKWWLAPCLATPGAPDSRGIASQPGEQIVVVVFGFIALRRGIVRCFCATEAADVTGPALAGVMDDHLVLVLKNTRLTIEQSSAESHLDCAVGNARIHEYLAQRPAGPGAAVVVFDRHPLVAFKHDDDDETATSAKERKEPTALSSENKSDDPVGTPSQPMRAFLDATAHILHPAVRCTVRSAVGDTVDDDAGSGQQSRRRVSKRLVLEVQPMTFDLDVALAQRLDALGRALRPRSPTTSMSSCAHSHIGRSSSSSSETKQTPVLSGCARRSEAMTELVVLAPRIQVRLCFPTSSSVGRAPLRQETVCVHLTDVRISSTDRDHGAALVWSDCARVYVVACRAHCAALVHMWTSLGRPSGPPFIQSVQLCWPIMAAVSPVCVPGRRRSRRNRVAYSISIRRSSLVGPGRACPASARPNQDRRPRPRQVLSGSRPCALLVF